MKTLNLITLSLLTAGLTAPVFAQQTEVEQNDFYLGARLGVFSADDDRVAVKNQQLFFVDDGFKTITSGIEAGMMFTEAWEARIYYDYMEADLVGGGDGYGDSYGDSYGVDALYHFNNSFYAGLGVNNTEIGDVTDVAARLTLGHRSFINDNLAWRIEGGAQRGWEEDYTEMFANIGLQWFFGGRDTSPEPRPRPEPQPEPQQAAPEPESEPVDSDGDGVVDSKDNCANTPKNYSVDENGCILYENETITEELLVEFDLNSSEIRSGERNDIDEMAEFMKEHPQLDITIHGHTDSTGEAEYNQWLSERRAEAVANALVEKHGIARSRVDFKGHGESQPKVRENSAADRQTNRRIEATLKVVNRVPKTR
ncbi:OmpA family protein [Idiomarina abyssalis]|uniref:OmpA family protein n=1 Tax=Idiomarina abyssalis TaxID=86102 RepID=UPI00230068EE|nr:OmpA family protein [Idiomarina abyssalis]MDA6066889.1 OmpA family protein [Idiomarina abyssalis]